MKKNHRLCTCGGEMKMVKRYMWIDFIEYTPRCNKCGNKGDTHYIMKEAWRIWDSKVDR